MNHNPTAIFIGWKRYLQGKKIFRTHTLQWNTYCGRRNRLIVKSWEFTSPTSRGRIASGEERGGKESSILYKQVGVGGQLIS